jgi:hypothetical protein
MKKTITVIIILLIILGVAWWLGSKTDNSQQSDLDFGSTVTVAGEVVCLPHKDQSGPQTMECAFGLEDDNGDYYGLSDLDQATMGGVVDTGKMITVTGTLAEPEANNIYDVVAVIEVDTVAPVDDENNTATTTTGETYSDPQGRFSIKYSPDFGVAKSGEALPDIAKSYIPACEEGFMACVYYQAENFVGTNFGSAGIAITTPTMASEAACKDTTGYNGAVQNSHSETFGGADWLVFESGDAATSHYANDTIYRTWHDNTCYQLDARIGYSNFEVYEPGSIKEFTDTDRANLRDKLTTVVKTFTF